VRRFPKWIAAAVAGLAGAWLWGSELRAADTPRPALTIFVYNYAGIEPKALGDTKRIAGRVLREAGVQVRWRNAPVGRMERNDACRNAVFGPATLVLRLLSGEMTQRLGFEPNHYGFAQSTPAGGFPFVAGVFCQRAEQLAKGTPSLLAVILGHLVAHEIGHLLLGPYGHSERGIMRAPWTEVELEIARRGTLHFSRSEASRMQSNVQARIGVMAQTME
jgi:hypothetical protein